MSDALFQNLQSYVVGHHPGAVVSDFSLLSGGWECDIYAARVTFSDGHTRDLVLRLFLGQDGPEKTSRESHGIRLLHRMGYPVPEVFFSETDASVLGHAFILMEKVEGQSLWGALNTAGPSRETSLLDQFGQRVAQLHQLDWTPFVDPERAARIHNEPV